MEDGGGLTQGRKDATTQGLEGRRGGDIVILFPGEVFLVKQYRLCRVSIFARDWASGFRPRWATSRDDAASGIGRWGAQMRNL